ncbi:hypothetical protein IWX75_001578 [Arthrobacter sp. CAN_A6]|uniref:hemerythrin domain-containing protein n=1 Tax=Arthrobacter sp. CAN_A6 TaxID=2787721 RepID=UPI0018C8E77C
MYQSVAKQTVAELGGPTSVLVRQKNDHVKLNALLKELEGSSGAEQGDVLRRIYRLVFPHAFAEEAVLWAVVRRVLPDGEQLTLKVEQEHQEVNELVTRLETLEEGDPERERVLDRLVEVLGEDVARRPPGNAVAAVPLSLIDRIRDAVDTAILQRPKAVPPVLHRTSTLLARVAHSIEHLPLLTHGEDPSTSRGGRRSDGSRRRRPPLAGVVVVAAEGVVAGELVFRALTRRARR